MQYHRKRKDGLIVDVQTSDIHMQILVYIYKVPLRKVPKGVAQERNPSIQHLTVGK